MVVASHFSLLLKDKDKEQYRKQCKDEEKYQKQLKDEGKYEQFPALLDYCSAVAAVAAGAERYQERFPAFRDSQQTNIFFRTLSIVTDDVEKSVITSPQIFEIGRNGFVRLAQEKNEDLNYHPSDNTLEQTITRLLLLAGIVVSLICFHWAIRPDSRESTRSLLGGTSVIFAIAWFFAMDKTGEPLSFTDGISLWPTIFIQIIAIFLAGWFFVQAMFELEGNFCRLSVRYFLSRLRHLHVRSNRCELRASRWHSLGPWLEGLSGSGWTPFAVLIGTIVVYAWNDVYPTEFPVWLCLVILVGLAIIYLKKIGPKDNVSIKHWMEAENWGHPPQVNHESVLWKDYSDYGLFRPRIARVVWIWLIFAIIETLLAYLLPPWPLPWRGATDWVSPFEMARLIGVLSFTVTMLLLFFILDAVRLNFYWIKKLRTQHPLFTVQNPSIAGLASLKDMVSLVAERTRVVDKLIYYPMLCIMLMLFANITYFDNQEFPLSKGITFGAAISFLFFSGFMLRREANELKHCVKKSVRVMCVNNNNNILENETISRIDAIDEGAFQPMLEQPVMQALLMILASIGLFAGEYLKLLG